MAVIYEKKNDQVINTRNEKQRERGWNNYVLDLLAGAGRKQQMITFPYVSTTL